MKKKTRLLKNIREEFNTHYRRLESSQEGKFTYYLMGLIIDHIEHNYDDEDNKFIKEIMKYPDPLKSLHDIFCEYVDLEDIFNDVFNEFFVGSPPHRKALNVIAEELYGDDDDDDFYDDDDFEYTDEDYC